MKLTDSHLVLLSRATQRDDAILELPSNLRGAAAEKAVRPLLKARLIEEVQARPSQPVWRRDEQEGPIALIITNVGLKAIHAGANESKTGEGDRKKPKPSPRPRAAKRQKPNAKEAKPVARKTGSASQQDKIIALLRRAQGATIAAHHEGDGLAAAFGARVLCRDCPQEAQAQADVGGIQGRAGLPDQSAAALIVMRKPRWQRVLLPACLMPA